MLVAPEPQIRAEMLLTAAKITLIWIYIFEVVDLFEVAMTCVYRLKKKVKGKINIWIANPYFYLEKNNIRLVN